MRIYDEKFQKLTAFKENTMYDPFMIKISNSNSKISHDKHDNKERIGQRLPASVFMN